LLSAKLLGYWSVQRRQDGVISQEVFEALGAEVDAQLMGETLPEQDKNNSSDE